MVAFVVVVVVVVVVVFVVFVADVEISLTIVDIVGTKFVFDVVFGVFSTCGSVFITSFSSLILFVKMVVARPLLDLNFLNDLRISRFSVPSKFSTATLLWLIEVLEGADETEEEEGGDLVVMVAAVMLSSSLS